MADNFEKTGLGPSFIGLSEQVALHGRFRPGDTAFVDESCQLDWQGFNTKANAVAQQLLALGVQPGDRVAMLCGSCVSTLVVIFGVWRADAAYVPLSTMLPAKVLASLIEDCGADILLVDPHYQALADELAGICEARQISIDDAFQTEDSRLSRYEPNVRPAKDALANIIYSSGTTGLPKGISHTHEARIGFVNAFSAPMMFKPDSRVFLAIPPFSNGAMLSWGPACYIGAPTIIMRAFDVEAFFALVREWKPTHGFIVPTMCHALLSHPDVENAGLECFECALTAGAPMPIEIKREMQRLTDGGLGELWGLTESVATFISPNELAQRPDSVGRPALGMDIRIIDKNDNDVSFQQVGEIVGRSTNLMQGYWNRPEINRALVWHSPDGLNYIRTGDIGELDSDGYLSIRGRVKDMIISGGVNVFPVDIEAVLLEHEDVDDATVIGLADAKWGEIPVACVILQEDKQISCEALMEWTNEQLAKHQRIKRLHVFNADFPRNALGKVLKNELRDRLAENSAI